MIKPTIQKEQALIKDGVTHVIGVDEVGVGCLAGPVVTAALRFEASFFDDIPEELELVRDSKTLSHLQREKLDKRIRERNDIEVLLTKCTPATIDKYNIYRATRRASLAAAEKMCKDIERPFVLFDGPKKLESQWLEQEAIIKGDQKVFAIAAASIIAKVYRDNLMLKYDKQYPEYGFAQHKGYGTAHHMAQLASLGPTPIHRKSFKPVSSLEKA